jgi:3-oxoacyl-[acyl-carrier protein] reductase
MRLEGKVAVVTGAQQGIGEAIALAFAREGAHLVVNWLDDEAAAQAVADGVRGHGGRAELVRGDVAEARDIGRLIDTADALGGVDLMVNNAAIFPRVALLDMSEDDWDAVHRVNLRGSFLGLQAAARAMVAHGRGGAIVNFSSRAAFAGSPRGVHYVATKAGVLGLTRAAALELAPHRIRVNAIAPGLVDTAQPRYGMTEAEIAEAGRRNPLGRSLRRGRSRHRADDARERRRGADLSILHHRLTKLDI